MLRQTGQNKHSRHRETTIAWFNMLGWPKIIRSNGGPQFRSEFDEFCEEKDIVHELTSPYNPQANGLAEAAVKNCKHLLIKCLQTGEDFQEALSAWRTIPREDKLSPYEILFSKKPKMHLPSLTAKNADPISLAAKDKASQRTVSYFNRRTKPLSIFEPGDHVTMRHHATGRWDTDAIILTRRPDGYSYIIQTKNGQEFLRGRRWLKSRRPERNTPMRIQHPRSNLQFDHEVTQLNNRHNSPNLRRSERIRNRQSK